MQVIHLNLKLIGEDYAELRYFLDNPNRYQSRRLPLAEVSEFITTANRDYYVPLPADYVLTGWRLYDWLDGDSRFLQRALDEHRRQGIILAISTTEKLAHLPWEILHDGQGFLVQHRPAIIPLRWVADRQCLSVEDTPENRSLQVLFMATSPLDIKPVLDFEGEEGRILDATKRQPLSLIVEESGCLTELGYLVEDYGKGYFDVLHLTGHATFEENQPRFITETETGEPFYASAEDIATELQFQLPKLIFLSGCRTGQSPQLGEVSSMAEALLDKGAKVVLGWGNRVLERDAIAAAEALYRELAAGKTLTEAVGITYQTLIENKARDWHLLRLYATETLPGGLVTPLRTRGRLPAPPLSVTTEFLDPAGKVKVPTRQSFVGRRRQLQSCLRELKLSLDRVGVLIHGMGGLGKSSLAARLCDRLPEFERVVWVEPVDEPSLVNRLTDKLDGRELREMLQNPQEELKFRLRRVFRQLETSKPFLLVLDDFEINLEPRGDDYVILEKAERVLEALVWAIRETDNRHRIVITSRYDFRWGGLKHFYKQPLEALRGADLQKKCKRLLAFGEESEVEEELQSQAKGLADGNPRLLEWLNLVLQAEQVDRATILEQMASKTTEFRANILAQELLKQQSVDLRKMLGWSLVYELPVPKIAIVEICSSIPNLDRHINHAIALGLLEFSNFKSESYYRVPRILEPLLMFPADAEILYSIAAKVLFKVWFGELISRFSCEQPQTKIEMHKIADCILDDVNILEVYRLAVKGREIAISVIANQIVAVRWYRQDRFREVVKICNRTLDITEDYHVFHTLAKAEERLGNTENCIEHYLKALKLCPLGNKKEESDINHNFADFCLQIGQLDMALELCEKVIEVDEQIGNLEGKAIALHLLGDIYREQGKLEEAVNFYQQSIEIRDCRGDAEGIIATLNNMAMTQVELGNVEAWTDISQRLFELSEQNGGIQNIGRLLTNYAFDKLKKGYFEVSDGIFKQALESYEYSGDSFGKTIALHNQATLYADRGQLEKALNIYGQALEISQQSGYLKVQASILHEIAFIYANKEQIQQAILVFGESSKISETIGNLQGKAANIREIASIYIDQDRLDDAKPLLQQALDLFIQSNDIRGRALTLHKMGVVYAKQGQLEQAINFVKQSLKLNERTGDIRDKAADLATMGQLLTASGEIDNAMSCLQQSISIYQQFNSPNLEQVYKSILSAYSHKLEIIHNLAIQKAIQGKLEEAIVLCQQSLQLAEHIGNLQDEAVILVMLGQLLAYEKGDFDTALDYLQQSLEILQYIQSPDAEMVKEAIANVQQMAENSERG